MSVHTGTCRRSVACYSLGTCEAEALVAKELLGNRPVGAYQPLGDLILKFSAAGEVTDYRRDWISIAASRGFVFGRATRSSPGKCLRAPQRRCW